MYKNQAVIFTKPLHHLSVGLTSDELKDMVISFFLEKNFSITLHREVSGSELSERSVIQQHYVMYSTAACAETIPVTLDGREKFKATFAKNWEDEEAAGRILSTAQLLKTRDIDVHTLFTYWNDLFAAGKTAKLQDGLIIAWVEELDAYCINAFYPSMEANYYHPDTIMHYFVVEFDPAYINWKNFRKEILGATNASQAVSESFRERLYADFPVLYPGRDNFVHGSAGPLESFVERAIHEDDFKIDASPIGCELLNKGVTLDTFNRYKQRLSITELGALFDATEEKDTAEVIEYLQTIELF